MTTHRIGSNWLDDPDDSSFLKKSEGKGLGRVVLPDGQTVGDKVTKMLGAVIVCKSGCSMRVVDARDSMTCQKHGEPLGLVGEESEQTGYKRTVKSMAGETYAGGYLDGVPTTTNPNKPRRPIVRDETPRVLKPGR